jgi:hypothetical protein
MLELVRKNIPSEGYFVFRNIREFEDRVHGVSSEENALSLSQAEELICDNMARVLVALETVAEYHTRLISA